jgi:hypothetical protein
MPRTTPTEKELEARSAKRRAANALADDLDMTRRQEAFHDHPSHPTTCLAYREHYGRRCVCMDYQPPGDCC